METANAKWFADGDSYASKIRAIRPACSPLIAHCSTYFAKPGGETACRIPGLMPGARPGLPFIAIVL
jgi:hypothetical protein